MSGRRIHFWLRGGRIPSVQNISRFSFFHKFHTYKYFSGQGSFAHVIWKAAWNSKGPVQNGCLVKQPISYIKDLESSNRNNHFVNGWPWVSSWKLLNLCFSNPNIIQLEDVCRECVGFPKAESVSLILGPLCMVSGPRFIQVAPVATVS